MYIWALKLLLWGFHQSRNRLVVFSHLSITFACLKMKYVQRSLYFLSMLILLFPYVAWETKFLNIPFSAQFDKYQVKWDRERGEEKGRKKYEVHSLTVSALTQVHSLKCIRNSLNLQLVILNYMQHTALIIYLCSRGAAMQYSIMG